MKVKVTAPIRSILDSALMTPTQTICTLALFVAGAAAHAAPVAPEPDIEIYRRRAMDRDGDAVRGKDLFETSLASCATCHSVDGKSAKVGPDLSAIGDQFSRSEIIDSILHPSARIAVGYATTRVETTSGDEYTGVLKEAGNDSIELATASGERVRVAASEIKSRQGSELSLMPEGLHSGFSTNDFCSLVEYLVSLKEQSNSAVANTGMPETIPELQPAIALQPILEKPLRTPHASKGIQAGLVALAAVPGFNGIFLVADQSGILWRLEKCAAGVGVSVFADLTDDTFSARGPNGLLGLAFHPKFRENRKYYLKRQVFEDACIITVLEERYAATNFTTDAAMAPRRLLAIRAVAEHHNGGCIQFGPDGFLYFAMGDSAPNDDPRGHGQDLGLLLGKMLRIDVDQPDARQPYGIPRDNPFRARPGIRPEIWASGFREPWRFSFDPVTGDLWVADLGQERGDEVSIVRRGENHGWNVYEGFELFSNSFRRDRSNYIAPIFAARRRHGTAVVGGCVYRGNPQSPFYGAYIFGDHNSKRIWELRQKDGSLKSIRQIASCPQSITAFATDERGAIYVVGYQGMIYELNL
jgi:putative heme-binding domain-containing protein